MNVNNKYSIRLLEYFRLLHLRFFLFVLLGVDHIEVRERFAPDALLGDNGASWCFSEHDAALGSDAKSWLFLVKGRILEVLLIVCIKAALGNARRFRKQAFGE